MSCIFCTHQINSSLCFKHMYVSSTPQIVGFGLRATNPIPRQLVFKKAIFLIRKIEFVFRLFSSFRVVFFHIYTICTCCFTFFPGKSVDPARHAILELKYRLSACESTSRLTKVFRIFPTRLRILLDFPIVKIVFLLVYFNLFALAKIASYNAI